MNKNSFIKFIAIMLCFMMVFSLFPASVFAKSSIVDGNKKTQEEPNNSTNGGEYDFSATVIAKDEYSTTYENDDGTNTDIMYSSPVRIKNKDGSYKDIDTSIKKLTASEKTKKKASYEYSSTITEADVFCPKM